ncbi:MAG: Omp28-related outer membrane protein [Flavobacteriales bacterium]
MKTSKLTIFKYISLSILGLGLALSSCKKEESNTDPEPKTNPASEPTIVHKKIQVPIVVKATGENCPPCGSWGWTDWINLSNDLAGKAFCWANYAGGYAPANGFRGKELRAPTSDAAAFLGRFSGVTGYPNFVTNMTSAGTSSSDAKIAAEASIANTDIKLSAGFKHKIEGNTLTIEAQTKVWENVTGTYYMGAYLVENDITAYQAGSVAGGANAKHHLVFRGSLSSSSWGEKIIDGSADQDMILNKTYSVEIPSGYNKDNFTYGIIIWKKVGGTYQYVNAATNQVAH